MVAAIAGAALVARWLARLIGNIRRATESIAAGDLQTRAVERGPHEFVMLTHAINTMAHQLAERLERLETQAELQRRFYRDVSHELRTPLMALGGYLENIEDAETIDEQTYAITALHGEIARLSRLADEFLRGEASPQLEIGPLRPIDLTDLVDQTIDALRNRATRSGVNLARIGETNIVMIAADRDRIKQVLLNILDNALRATPPGGTISIAIEAAPDAALIDIHDDGSGIPAALQDAIWERGVRGADGGSGLGLAIVRSIIQAHGGEATLIPSAVGAHIRLKLPRS
jgi:signal transduction histidine kinase